jgi:hypothetical protein
MLVYVTRCLFALALLCSVHAGLAQVPSASGEIAPPYGLMWHESSERVEARIEATKSTTVERRKIGQRWAIIVSGFKEDTPRPPPAVTQMIFYFVGGQVAKTKTRDGKPKERLAQGQMVEVEFQYQQPGWNEDRYGMTLGEKRRYLDRSFGQGQQIVRSTTPTPDGLAAQTMVGYKWNKNNTAIELIYFHVVAKTGQQEFHTLSLHYKRL